MAAAAMRQQAQGGQGRGGYQAARFQEPYEKLVPAKDVGAGPGGGGLGGGRCTSGSRALPARPPACIWSAGLPCCHGPLHSLQMLRELSAMGLGADQVDPLWDAYTVGGWVVEPAGSLLLLGAAGRVLMS